MLQAGTFDDVAVAVMVHPGPTDIAAARSLALSEAIVDYLRQGIACRRRAVSGTQRRRRRDRRAGGHRVAAAATRAGADDARHRHRRRAGGQRHPRARDVAVCDAGDRIGFAARAGGQDVRVLCRGRAGRGLRIRNRQPGTRLRRTQARPTGWPRSAATRCAGSAAQPVAPEVEAALPMGSTDMGNVTQVLPGIHPVIGVDAGGATVHQRAFAAAAAGPSADRAVVDGAIMLARTVVQLAQNPAERDRVLAAQQRTGRGGMSSSPRLMPPTILAGRTLRRPGRLAAPHPPLPGVGPSGVRHHAVRRRAVGRRRAQPEGAARRNRSDL